MSEESHFVPVTSLIGSNNSWADEEQEQQIQPEAKPKNAWGSVQKVEVIDIAKVEEDAKRAKKEALENVGWATVGKDAPSSGRPAQGQSQTYEPPSRRENREPREQREPRGERTRNPVPDSPPFTAFVGNLTYEVDSPDLTEFFDGLIVKEARVVKENGKSKGFGYVEFGDKSSLEKALTADGTNLKGRNLNIDVAKPSAGWGSSGSGSGAGSGYGSSSKYGNKDRGFGSGFGDREPRDSFGGEGSGRGRGGFGARGFSRGGGAPHPAGERPKLDLKPRTKPLDNPPPVVSPSVATPSSSAAAAKAGGENPFGFDMDRSKLDKAAEERLKIEQQREQKRKQEQARLEHEREVAKSGFSKEKKEWRTERTQEPAKTRPYGGRGGAAGSGRGSTHKDTSGTSAPKKSWDKPSETKKSEEVKGNIYAVLGDEGGDDEGDQDQ